MYQSPHVHKTFSVFVSPAAVLTYGSNVFFFVWWINRIHGSEQDHGEGTGISNYRRRIHTSGNNGEAARMIDEQSVLWLLSWALKPLKTREKMEPQDDSIFQ